MVDKKGQDTQPNSLLQLTDGRSAVREEVLTKEDCPLDCTAPKVNKGDPSNGGKDLVWVVGLQKCTFWASKVYESKGLSQRFCGDGSSANPKAADYTDGGVNCAVCGDATPAAAAVTSAAAATSEPTPEPTPESDGGSGRTFFPPTPILAPSPPSPTLSFHVTPRRISDVSLAHLWRISDVSHVTVCYVSV